MTTLQEQPSSRAMPPASGPLRLEDPRAALPHIAGSKAAHLARAARAGLPVLPGFVIPCDATAGPDATDATDARVGLVGLAGGVDALRRAWGELSAEGALALAVRSSSPHEDTQESSLAGQFASVLDVRGWAAFRAAIRTVLDSARRPDGSTAPMAVLVQPMLVSEAGGVVFGADPVAGRVDRMLVSVVRGGPDALVSGELPGTNHTLSRRGRILHTEPPGAEQLLTGARLRRLARLSRRAAAVFGGPQDVEFGFDADGGRLWLFQSRPITAMAARPGHGARLLGPGPVAETLPDRLQPLEEDLWVAPMARGLAAALDIAGAAPRRLLRTAPAVTAVAGYAAADLRLLGAVPPQRPWLALLNPAPGARRLGAAWRLGRLTAALPGLALDLTADIDRRLTETDAASELTTADLTTTLRWTRAALVSLHAQEALCGALLRVDRSRAADGRGVSGVAGADAGAGVSVARQAWAGAARGSGTAATPRARTTTGTAHATGGPRTAAGAALAALTRGRELGLSDELLVASEPVVLALFPPRLDAGVRLPRTPSDRPGPTAVPSVGALPPREALRLRIRWVQELQVRLVREAARRLARAGAPLGGTERVGLLRWSELMGALAGAPLPADVAERLPRTASAPLPDAFRLAGDGTVVAERPPRRRRFPARRESGRDGSGSAHGYGGQGVSGGRVSGTAWDGNGPRPPDAVLVTRTLDPALAPLLPELAGLVAQTGSPLSHLALLAREFGVPTVVGVVDAVRHVPPGTRLVLDGTTGAVRLEEAAPTASASRPGVSR